MVPQKKNHEGPMPVTDEGWWDSVLADEQRFIRTSARQQSKNEGQSREAPPDWQMAKDLYDQDAIVSLKVSGYNRGGLLVDGEGINGFVPYSHLVEVVGNSDGDHREKYMAEYVGRTMRLKVIECVPEDGRIVFSERAAQAEAGRRRELFDTLVVGQQVTGEVTNITDFGVFIDLGGVEGLIHISELSWGRVAHPSQIVSLGQSLKVQVLDVSPERCRVALSLKRLFENPWESAGEVYAIGQVVSATITSIVSYGAFARLEEGLEGLFHSSEMPLGDEQVVKDLLKEGQEVQVRVLHIDAEHQRLGLSLKILE
jgi:small subunit ribosomal protein S1